MILTFSWQVLDTHSSITHLQLLAAFGIGHFQTVKTKEGIPPIFDAGRTPRSKPWKSLWSVNERRCRTGSDEIGGRLLRGGLRGIGIFVKGLRCLEFMVYQSISYFLLT